MAIETLPSEKSTRSTAVPENAPQKPKKKSRRTLWLTVGIGAVLAVLMIVVVVQSKKGAKPITVTVEKAAIRTITQIVSATGKVYPETEVKLSPEVSGEIVELPVKEGDVVRRGQLLFKINPQLSRTQVEQAQSALSAAKAASLRAKAEQLRTAEEYRHAFP